MRITIPVLLTLEIDEPSKEAAASLARALLSKRRPVSVSIREGATAARLEGFLGLAVLAVPVGAVCVCTLCDGESLPCEPANKKSQQRKVSVAAAAA